MHRLVFCFFFFSLVVLLLFISSGSLIPCETVGYVVEYAWSKVERGSLTWLQRTLVFVVYVLSLLILSRGAVDVYGSTFPSI